MSATCDHMGSRSGTHITLRSTPFSSMSALWRCEYNRLTHMTTNEALAHRIGIGPALRKARLLRSKSIEEASRETHIRAEYLHALEHEQFDALLGDVYVRAFLRSY